MKTNRIIPLAVLAALALSPAHAAVVTWSAPVTITSEEVIQANVSSAFNLHNVNST